MSCKLLLLFLAISGGNCAAIQERIVGGQTASIQEYPYQISMRWTYGLASPMHFCGGSIVSRNHIVTAAHCVYEKQSPSALRSIQIYTGTSRSDALGGGKAHGVRSVNVHPGYRGAANTYLNDIAVVTLSDPIDFDSTQQAVKLPTRNIQNGASAVITGWGYTRANGNTPVNLRKANMRLMVSSQCQRQLPFTLSNTQVCAISSYGVGVCSGDSGGPLVSNGELVGVASYVVECGKDHPDVYTNVYSYVSFVKQVINSGRI